MTLSLESQPKGEDGVRNMRDAAGSTAGKGDWSFTGGQGERRLFQGWDKHFTVEGFRG